MSSASATSLSHYTFTNVGPLTTTWTAPQSCVTQADVYLAATEIPDEPYLGSKCDSSPLGNCYVGGATQIDEIYSINRDSWDGYVAPYYSPGLSCPDKYTTAGIAIKDGDGKLVSSSGFFAPTTYGTMTIGPGPEPYTSTQTRYQGRNTTRVSTETVTTTWAPYTNPQWNVFMEALAPSETAVVCCPRYVPLISMPKGIVNV
jgi:hypothetical protein